MRFARTVVATFALISLVACAVAPAAHAGKPTRSPLRLTADAVVPGPGDTFATGIFKFSFSRDEICYEVGVDGLSGFIDRIAIHRGLPGQNGPEVALLSPSPIGIHGLWGCRTIDRNLAREISRNPGGYYMVVKTGAYPNGALRGQLRQ